MFSKIKREYWYRDIRIQVIAPTKKLATEKINKIIENIALGSNEINIRCLSPRGGYSKEQLKELEGMNDATY